MKTWAPLKQLKDPTSFELILRLFSAKLVQTSGAPRGAHILVAERATRKEVPASFYTES
jgi:hypothetical protein